MVHARAAIIAGCMRCADADADALGDASEGSEAAASAVDEAQLLNKVFLDFATYGNAQVTTSMDGTHFAKVPILPARSR